MRLNLIAKSCKLRDDGFKLKFDSHFRTIYLGNQVFGFASNLVNINIYIYNNNNNSNTVTSSQNDVACGDKVASFRKMDDLRLCLWLNQSGQFVDLLWMGGQWGGGIEKSSRNGRLKHTSEERYKKYI